MQSIEFIGFSGDCLVSGQLELRADRLSDELNAAESVSLRAVRLESLWDGHVVEMPELTIEQADLFAVLATGPRGDANRRIKTRQIRMQLSLGPYVVLGNLHTYPGTDPMISVMRRSPMVPLTNATIAFAREGTVVAQDAEALMVNRNLADTIRQTADEAIHFPSAVVIAA